MRRLLTCMLLVAFVLSSSYAYAGAINAKSDTAATITLFNAGKERVTFENDIAITSFTAVTTNIYQDGQTDSTTTLISNIEYELIVTDNEYFPVYVVSGSDMVNPEAPLPGAHPGLGGPFPFIYEGGISHTGNVIFNVVLGVIPGEGYANNHIEPKVESIIGVVLPDALPFTSTVRREIEISDVVISDLVTGEIIAVLDKVEMGTENRIVLEKLSDIRESIEKNKGLLHKILKLVRRLLRRRK